MRYFVRQQVLIQLYYSLIYAFLAYSLINWGRPLIIFQKKAVRIIIFSDYKSHSCPLLREKRLLKLCDLIYLDIAFLMNDFYSNSFLSKYTFKPLKKVHQYETRPASNKPYYLLIAGTIVHS